MNVFKFKAWLKEENCWADSVTVYGDGSYSCELGDVGGEFSSEVVQYTNMNDKDGAEIYAGSSIFEFDYAGDPCTVKLKGYFSFNEEYLMYVIKFETEPVYKNIFEYCGKAHKITNLKVVGTLQENPELLEGN